jgi:hypothetical protein
MFLRHYFLCTNGVNFFLFLHLIKSHQVVNSRDILLINLKKWHNGVIPLNTCIKKFYTVGEYKLNPFLKCLMCLELEKKLHGA